MSALVAVVVDYPFHYPTDSLDEHAFRRAPEVGAEPDMINDDLPSNLDYLDASFGAAAGFRELRDEDLDEFDVEDIPVSGVSSAGVISSVGGETIRVLAKEGIHVVEHYFDTLPPDSADDTSQCVSGCRCFAFFLFMRYI